ncbi:MAG: hypothetical protein ACRCU3_03570 [Eubacteriaceae bacterium]
MNIKRIFVVLPFFFLIFFSGCTKKELINDPSTGDILLPNNNATVLNDGIYKASTKYFDQRGYGQLFTLLVKNGIITQATLQEFDMNMVPRLQIDGSEKAWEGLTNKSLETIYYQLSSEFILDQSPKDIDVITGATETSKRFITLANVAYRNALLGNESPEKVSVNDTYTIKSTPDAEGYQGSLSAIFNDDTLTSLDYDELRLEDGKMKSKTTDNDTGLTLKNFYSDLTNQVVEAVNTTNTFPDIELTPERQRFLETLSILKELRTPFLP